MEWYYHFKIFHHFEVIDRQMKNEAPCQFLIFSPEAYLKLNIFKITNKQILLLLKMQYMYFQSRRYCIYFHSFSSSIPRCRRCNIHDIDLATIIGDEIIVMRSCRKIYNIF